MPRKTGTKRNPKRKSLEIGRSSYAGYTKGGQDFSRGKQPVGPEGKTSRKKATKKK